MSTSTKLTSKGLEDTIATLEEVIRSEQEPGLEHEPTPTEYFALISTTLSVGAGGERLPELLKVLLAVIPNTSKAILRMQFKSLSQSLLAILQKHVDDDSLVHGALQLLGALMQQQDCSDGFWSAVHALQAVNALLSFADSESPKVRKTAHDQLLALLRSHQMAKSTSVRAYVGDFCVSVILHCSRSAYKRTHCVVLFLESALVHLPEDKLQSLLEYALRLQLCALPKLTAAVYRMFDMLYQSPYYAFPSTASLKSLQLLLRSRPATPDMEANTYYCTALASGLICARKRDRFVFAGASSGLALDRIVSGLVGMCESDFIQVHVAVGTALKRILCALLERKPLVVLKKKDEGAGMAAEGAGEEALLPGLLDRFAELFQLKFKLAWLYVMDAARSVMELFRHNGRPLSLLNRMVCNIAEIYQAIEMGVLQVEAALHMSLGDTLGTALRVSGVQTFLATLPLNNTDASSSEGAGLVSSSREWIVTLLHSNLKLMPCKLADFGNCILPIANEYYKLLKSSSTSSSTSNSQNKILRTRVTQLWSLLPEFCAYHVTDTAASFPRLIPILEKLFEDLEYPELMTYAVSALLHLAKGVRSRSPRRAGLTEAEADAAGSPELAALRSNAYKFVPLLLQHVENISIGETRFQEGVGCIAAWAEIAPSQLVAVVSKRLLQLVLVTTAAEGEENAAAAGWMAVMLSIIPLLPQSLVQLLFKSIRPLLSASETSSVQKRAYGLLHALLSQHRETVCAFEAPLGMLQAVSEALLTCHVSCRTMRFRCMEALMSLMGDAELRLALPMAFKEVLVCQKDANKKSRDGAHEILHFFVERVPAAELLPYLAQALGESNSKIMRSSAVTGLCLLVLARRAEVPVLAAGVELLPQVGQLLVDDCPHQSKAVLSYLRVFASVQPVDVLLGMLGNIVAAFTQSLGTHKAKFAPRCRAIMRKLVHRLGEEAVRPVVPESDVALLDYICRQSRRTLRRRVARDRQSRADRMLGSDSEDSDDDMDEEEGGGSLHARMQGSLAPVVKESAVREDYRMGPRPRAMCVGDERHSALTSASGSALLPTTLDDLLDDQPSALRAMREEMSVGVVGGNGGARAGKRGRAPERVAERREEEDQYNVMVTAEGKVVVKEREEEVEVSAKRDRKREPEEAPAPAPIRPEAPSKRRKLNLKAPGEEYKAKKAGGDVWKKGMLEPHAFIPLDPRLLSKKHRTEAISHFGMVIKGGKKVQREAKNKRGAGKRGGSGGGKQTYPLPYTVAQALLSMAASWRKACYNCGQGNCPSGQKCSACLIARYCSKECQRAHWKIHKQVCKVDTEDGMRKVKFPNFNKTCLHGAPSRARMPEIANPVLSLFTQLCAIPDLFVPREGRDPRGKEIRLLLDFCAQEAAAASSPKAPLILVSMAAEALNDKQYSYARNMLRTAFFLEAFQMYDSPEGLDRDLHLTEVDANNTANPGLQHLAVTAEGVKSIKGIFKHICDRVSCDCFVVVTLEHVDYPTYEKTLSDYDNVD
ncbi:armadillo-type protein [Ochromonadaceae sp. CCMP2298]|nr:armadillo-type protein [Ochromonadaceae sp. CCMP2298]